jgi:hypothetical protein
MSISDLSFDKVLLAKAQVAYTLNTVSPYLRASAPLWLPPHPVYAGRKTVSAHSRMVVGVVVCGVRDSAIAPGCETA